MKIFRPHAGVWIIGLASQAVLAAEKKAPASSMLTDDNITTNLLQTTLGLLLVLGLIAAAAWAVKRFGHIQSGVQGKMKVIGGVSLGTRERVVLLQVGEQQLVLGVAPGQIRTLHVLSAPLTIEDEPAGTDRHFAARLQSAIKARGARDGSAQ